MTTTDPDADARRILDEFDADPYDSELRIVAAYARRLERQAAEQRVCTRIVRRHLTAALVAGVPLHAHLELGQALAVIDGEAPTTDDATELAAEVERITELEQTASRRLVASQGAEARMRDHAAALTQRIAAARLHIAQARAATPPTARGHLVAALDALEGNAS